MRAAVHVPVQFLHALRPVLGPACARGVLAWVRRVGAIQDQGLLGEPQVQHVYEAWLPA